MKYLFGHLLPIGSLFKEKQVLLFMDFDGTLCPIAERPEMVELSRNIKLKIRSIAADERCRFVIITGRQLSDIKNLVQIPGVIFSGNHGLEIETPDLSYNFPVSEKYKNALHYLKEIFIKEISSFNGIIVEDKGLSLCVHYRMLDFDQIQELKTVFNQIILSCNHHDTFTVKQGKKVLEIRPALCNSKSAAVQEILKEIASENSSIPFYFGDDTTDDDVFEVIRPLGLTVKVGEESEHSQAEYYVKDSREVELFLAWFINTLGIKNFSE